jgi:hypothetical protein
MSRVKIPKSLLAQRLQIQIGGEPLTVVEVDRQCVTFDQTVSEDDESATYMLEDIDDDITVDLGDPIDRLILAIRADALGCFVLAVALSRGWSTELVEKHIAAHNRTKTKE